MTGPVEEGAPPVGGDFGLEPRLDHTLYKPRVTSREIVSTEDYRQGTEYGGVSGIIQPPPHVPTASERLRMIYAIDPTDPGDEPGSVTHPDLTGDFSSRGY